MKTSDMTRDQFEQLPKIRTWSDVGPCIGSYRLLRENAKTVTVAFWNYDRVDTRKKYRCEVHTEPCIRCTDHKSTQYPMGYTN